MYEPCCIHALFPDSLSWYLSTEARVSRARDIARFVRLRSLGCVESCYATLKEPSG